MGHQLGFLNGTLGNHLVSPHILETSSHPALQARKCLQLNEDGNLKYLTKYTPCCSGMYHETSGRFDLQNIGEEEALRIQGTAGLTRPSWGQSFLSPLYRVLISTPTGEYVIGCLGWDRMADVKRKLLEVGF